MTGKGPGPPGLDVDGVAVPEASHVQLTGGGSPHRAMGHPVDHQAARAADPFPAVVIERDGDLPALHQLLVDHVEHLEERHVRADVASLVLHQPAFSAGAGLAPDAEGEVHRRLFVTPLRQVHMVEPQWLPVQPLRCIGLQILPGGDVGEELVVTQRLAILGLILDPEMSAARLLPVERVQAHELPQLQEVRHPAGLLQRLIQLRVAAGHVYVAPELRPELGNPA